MAVRFDYARLGKAVEEGMEAFFEKIAEHYTEIESGDFSPLATLAIEEAMLEAAETWVRGNSPCDMYDWKE